MSKTCAIVPAAGRGLRMGAAKPKQFLELSGKPILVHTLETLSRAPFLSSILLVVPSEFLAAAEDLVSRHGLSDGGGRRIGVIAGGAERQDSVRNGLQALPPDCDWVFIHDGVRPFATPALLKSTWDAALKTGAAIAALPASDTVKRVRAGHVVETVPREELWLVQTPQVFRREVLIEAYREAGRQGWLGTDDAFLVERLGYPVAVVLGERSNIKVTTPEDLAWGSWFLSQSHAPEELSADWGKGPCA